MIDQRPGEQEALWRELRVSQPPPGARERVAGAIDARIQRRGARLIRVAAPIAVAAAVALLVLSIRGRDDGRAPERALGTVIDGIGATQGDRPLAAGDRIGPGPVEVTGRLRAEVADSQIEIVGPAAVELGGREVILHRGAMMFEGAVDIAAPTCRARVKGRGKAAVVDAQLQITMFAGSAEIAPPVVECRVIQLTPAPPAPPPAAPQASGLGPRASGSGPRVAQVPSPPRTLRGRAAGPTPLQQQVDAYWAAQRRGSVDPAGGLAALREHRRRWPRAPIREEVDLAIIDRLLELGRTEQARREAAGFVRRHPRSSRAADVRRIADE